jgi:hypothetical protein
MKRTMLETVNGPNAEPACVSVFQCQRCGRLSAYALEKMNEPLLGESMNAN